MAISRSDTAAYLRGKAHAAGLRPGTPLALACDVLLALEVDGVPGKELREWRSRLDLQTTRASAPDRATWGATPQQVAATAKLTGSAVRT